MKTLSDQLTELYESKWEEANGLKDQLQCPFLISLYRSGQKGEEREKAKEADSDWYSKKKLQSMKNGTPKLTSKLCFLVRSHMDGKKI